MPQPKTQSASDVIHFALGGTIGSTTNAAGIRTVATPQSLTSSVPAAGSQNRRAGAGRVHTIELWNKDSSQHQWADLQKLLTLIELAAEPDPDIRRNRAGYLETYQGFGPAAGATAKAGPPLGIVVTHGTDTLEETASTLALLYRGTVPVIITGAQRPADHPEADGPANFAHALDLAYTPAQFAEGNRVAVTFGTHALAGFGIRKTHTEELAGFTGQPLPTAGPVNGITPLRSLTEPRVTTVVPSLDPQDTVPLRQLRWARESGYEAVIVEGFGSGNVPAALIEEIEATVTAELAVVITSRVPAGPVAAHYGGPGGGASLAANGCHFARELRGGALAATVRALLAGRIPADEWRDWLS